jgi:hypothetical protein
MDVGRDRIGTTTEKAFSFLWAGFLGNDID